MALELKLEDLIENCPTCQGTGKIDQRGQEYVRTNDIFCPACNGQKTKLSANGKVLKKFLSMLNSQPHLNQPIP